MSAFGQGPARFEPNVGQADSSVRWLRRGPSHCTLIGENGFTTRVASPQADDEFELPDTRGLSSWRLPSRSAVAVGFQFVDAAASTTDAVGERRLSGRTHYFRGSDPSAWLRDVPQFARLRLPGVWRDIDVVLHGSDGHLQYDFLVAPGGDPTQIALDVDGAESVTVDAAGDLVIHAGSIEIRHQQPVIYQDTAFGRRRVPGRFVIESSRRVRFDVDTYDQSLALVIDPTECVGHRFGGTLTDEGIAVAASPAGRVAVGGRTFSTDFSGTGSLANGGNGAGDAFVQYFPPAAFSTPGAASDVLIILGSDAEDAVTDLQFGPDGTIYMTGYTLGSATFPQVGISPSAGLGGQDGFLAEVSPTGEVIRFSQLIGGDDVDLPTSLELQITGAMPATTAIYLGMVSRSSDVPMTGTAPGGGGDPFVLQFNAAGTQQSGINLGGSGNDALHPVRIDVGPSNIAASFTTNSNDLTVSNNAFETSRTGAFSSVVQLLAPNLGAVQRSTFLSGSNLLGFAGMDRTADGRLFLAGPISGSTISPTADAFQSSALEFLFGVIYVVDADLRDAPYRSYVSAPSFTNLAHVLAPGPSADRTAVLFGGATRDGLEPVGSGASYNGPPADFLLLALEPDDYSVPFLGHFGGGATDASGHSGPIPLNALLGRGMAEDPTNGTIIIAGRTNSSALSFPILTEAEQGGVDAFAFPFDPAAIGAPAPPTTRIEIDSSSVRVTAKDSTKPDRDKFKFKFRFDPIDANALPAVGPGAEGEFNVNVRSQAQDESSVDRIGGAIPLESSGWKVAKAGTKLIYKSPRGEIPRVRVSFDAKKGSAKVDYKKYDYAYTLETIKLAYSLSKAIVGELRGESILREEIEEGDRTGVYRFSGAKTNVSGNLGLNTEKPIAGQTVELSLSVRNFQETPQDARIEVRFRGETLLLVNNQSFAARQDSDGRLVFDAFERTIRFTPPANNKGKSARIRLLIGGVEVQELKFKLR